ncbi:hypothetical protein BSKO_09351 [Bryopsis sp. KO-2023]|nr:hypothetical protein BSKO_09351 [Bryopsis sp. KO-2023]
MSGNATALIGDVWDWLVGPYYSEHGTRYTSFADKRVENWPLLDIRMAIAVSLAYLLGIPLLMRFMKHREPMKIKRFAALHNAILFSLSLYMCVETVRQAYNNFGWGQKFSLWCNPFEAGPDPFTKSGYALARVLWIHYLSKAYEFVDTFIMILKKNTRQISFLHVYHHATTFFPVWWSVIAYGAGGETWFCCALNSFIHVMMYGYYFFATFGIKLAVMKPFVTYSQMIQFLLFIAQGVYLLGTDCFRPRLVVVLLVFQCAIFFLLFANFAYKAYWKPKPKSKTR